MSNEKNLIPNNKRTPEERRENARKAGIKSGQVRRKRKAMKEQMELLLSMPFNLKDKYSKKIIEDSKNLGINPEELDNQMAMLVALWKTSIATMGKNQVSAFQEIRKVVQDENLINQTERVEIINDLPNDLPNELSKEEQNNLQNKDNKDIPNNKINKNNKEEQENETNKDK